MSDWNRTDAHRHVHGALGASHEATRGVHAQPLGLGRGVADHERAEQGEQRQARADAGIGKVVVDPREQEELDQAIDDGIQELARVAGRAGCAGHHSVQGVAEKRQGRENPRQAEVAERDRDASGRSQHQRQAGDGVRTHAQTNASACEGLQCEVAHFLNVASEQPTGASALDARGAQASRENSPPEVRKRRSPRHTEQANRNGQIVHPCSSASIGPTVTACGRACPKGTSIELRAAEA